LLKGSVEKTECGEPWHKSEDDDKLIVDNISFIKILSSLNTTIYFDVIKKEKQLHVSARGHFQVGSFGFAKKMLSATPC
jgi:cytochrome c oxidase assembly factor CtaG